MFDSATEIARQIRDREISSVEATQHFLDRIDRINPEINAVVTLADGAIEEAALADGRLSAGNLDGPLHGVPMTIKDCFDTAGVVSTWGTLGRSSFVPQQDATIVSRLKSNGAILLGKTNTPEFTLNFSTYNRMHGFTRNPYDLTRSPGGSSGGAAAAIATGLTGFDIGTDFGGSIRVPSHFCGITGIKPTSGSVPRTGLCLPSGLLMDFMSHIGPMARHVEDLALILPLIWGPDSIDTQISPVPWPDPGQVRLAGLRCLVMYDNGVAEPDEETKVTVRSAANLLSEAELRVSEGRLDGVTETPGVTGGLWSVGGYAATRALLNAAGTRPEEVANNAFLEPDPRTTSEADFARWREESDRVSGQALFEQLKRVEEYRSRMLQHMSQYDVLLSPVNAHYAQTLPAPGESPFPPAEASYTEAFDLTGWPSGVVRGGTSSDGMPIGVQITANPWRDDIVLAVMSHLEEALPVFSPPALAVG